ncbi:MAG TPA: hypothetical protein VIG24_18550 [Acidimicrobiia bacterium]
MNNGERFARLFRGFSGRYGRYDLAGKTSAKGKQEGSARTVDEPISLAAYQGHVDGMVGIGVIPLNEDNRVNFAAIDIDVYDPDAREKKKLTHEDVALALQDSPLIVTRSKSNGVHVWLFSAEGVSASLATDYLQAMAARLGVAGTEVFPKQTERATTEDVGNWINLPYFGGERTAVIPVKDGSVTSYIEPDIAQFLDIAEQAAATVTDDWLVDNTSLPESQRDGHAPAQELWFDGPPCLQALIAGHPERRDKIEKAFSRGEITQDQKDKQLAFTKPQLTEGARDVTFFNAGIYLRRRMNPEDPDSALDEADKKELLRQLEKVHMKWMLDVGDREGIERDLPRIAKQAAKGKWGYACTKEPLKSFCNRRLCFKRKFGIGTALNDASFEITGFTIVNTEDKQYYLNVGGKRVYVPDVATLLSQQEFGRIVTNATNRVWVNMQDAQYRQMMDKLLQEAEQKGNVIEGPPDADKHSILLNLLDNFIRTKGIARGTNDVGMFSGRVLISDDETEAWFKFDQFVKVVRQTGMQIRENVLANILTNDFGVLTKSTTVANRSVRPYIVNLKHLEQLLGEADNG